MRVLWIIGRLLHAQIPFCVPPEFSLMLVSREVGGAS